MWPLETLGCGIAVQSKFPKQPKNDDIFCGTCGIAHALFRVKLETLGNEAN